jgi:hypothetical protein
MSRLSALFAMFSSVHWIGHCAASNGTTSNTIFALNLTDNAIRIDDLELTETVVAVNPYFFNSSSFWSYEMSNETSVGFRFSGWRFALNSSELRSLAASLLEAAQLNRTHPVLALPTDVRQMILIRWRRAAEADGLIASSESTIEFWVTYERLFHIFDPRTTCLVFVFLSTLLSRSARDSLPYGRGRAIVPCLIVVDVLLVWRFIVHFASLEAASESTKFLVLLFWPCAVFKSMIFEIDSILPRRVCLGTCVVGFLIENWFPKLYIVVMFLPTVAAAISSVEPARYHSASVVIWLIYERYAVGPSIPGINITSLVCLAALPLLLRLVRSIFISRWKRYRLRQCKKKLLAEASRISTHHQTEMDKASDPCPICREDMTRDILITRCKHTFHRRCLHGWLAQSAMCPVCRVSLDYIHPEADRSTRRNRWSDW